MRRCREKGSKEEKLTDKEMENQMKQIDKQRKKYHEILSGFEWGKKENYHLCINTSDLEIKTIIPSLGAYIRNWFERREKQNEHTIIGTFFVSKVNPLYHTNDCDDDIYFNLWCG